MFVDTNDESVLDQYFHSSQHEFVLSVGDYPDFAKGWGEVNIYRVRDGAQIRINLQKAIDKGLKISSDLLSIAEIVVD